MTVSFRLIALSLLCVGAAACASHEAKPAAGEAKIGMANPASVHCTEQGGKLEIRTGKDGGQYGVCTLPDGRVCEEWALFRDQKCELPAQ